MRAFLVAAVLATGMAAPAMADGYGSQALLAGRYQAAETRIDARLATDPREPSALLNAAYLYRQTDRQAEARRLYAAVLAEANVPLDLASGRTVMSHDLARQGLATGQLASR